MTMKKIGNALLIGGLAGLATWLTTPQVLNVPTWAVFICWACYFLFGAEPRKSGKGLFQMVVGIVLGAIFLVLAPHLTPTLGLATFPFMVFVVAAGLSFMEWTPLHIVAAYFIGLALMFASGFPPDVRHVLILSSAAVMAFFLGWAYMALRSALFALLDRRSQTEQAVVGAGA
ncbi:MAG: DUF1097 domain-containing protein [Janthinobacterium lividum]